MQLVGWLSLISSVVFWVMNYRVRSEYLAIRAKNEGAPITTEKARQNFFDTVTRWAVFGLIGLSMFFLAISEARVPQMIFILLISVRYLLGVPKWALPALYRDWKTWQPNSRIVKFVESLDAEVKEQMRSKGMSD
jgi:hypothetical protein